MINFEDTKTEKMSTIDEKTRVIMTMIHIPEGMEIDQITFKKVEKKMTYEEIKEDMENRLNPPFLVGFKGSEYLTNKMSAKWKLFIVAKYLNPEGEKDPRCCLVLSGGEIVPVQGAINAGQPMFTSMENARQAIEILGEDVIRTALNNNIK